MIPVQFHQIIEARGAALCTGNLSLLGCGHDWHAMSHSGLAASWPGPTHEGDEFDKASQTCGKIRYKQCQRGGRRTLRRERLREEALKGTSGKGDLEEREGEGGDRRVRQRLR
eukprot:747739-Hanusia_phi.AAC.3